MRANLDRTEQRVLGVLIEKELSVPEIYPLTLNALVAGCNQKSNRDPVLELQEFEVEGAVTNLCLHDWAGRREGSRAVKYVHRVDQQLGVNAAEKAVLAELLLRGPQTPGELKPRLVRMGVELEPDAIAALLAGLAQKAEGALVELLPRQPRERDARWRHLLGPMVRAEGVAPTETGPTARAEPQAGEDDEILRRLTALEARVAALEAKVQGAERT